jgi:hypothetical protein
MANKKKTVAKMPVAKRQGKKTGKRSAVRTKKQTGVEPNKEASAGEFSWEQLCCDVQHELGENSKQIAIMMRKKMLKGNFSFAKMMLEIVKPKQACKGAGRLRRGPSLALSLAKEPEWTGPLPGEEIKCFDGSPEAGDEQKAAAC